MGLSNEALIIESLFRIPDKEGLDVDFKLNSAQRALDEGRTGRDLVPKARQEGISSYVLAYFLASCMMYRNTRAVVISHDRESTQRLLSRVKYYIETIRGPQPVIHNMSKNEITFPKMNSMFYLGTAGSRKFGRGDTITHLHCSEYAFWPDAKTIMTGLLQAVPMTGQIFIESTGNGFNDYYRRCMRAEEGRSVWELHFMPWHTFEEYTLELDKNEEGILMRNLNDEWEEPHLLKGGLTSGQLAWRRMKLDELDYDLTAFKQEYPMTLDECFQMSSESIFTKVLYQQSHRWKKFNAGFWILEGHPHGKFHYVSGCDVSAGVGKDASVNEIFCLETDEQVGEYITDRTDPEMFAHKIATINTAFGTAYTVVEQNNHGILTLATLKKLYPRNRIHSTSATQTTDEERRLFNLGYKTTSRTKPLMIGNLRTMLAKQWKIYSPILRSQLTTFIEQDGKLGAQDGCNDDTVMAAACAAAGLNRAAFQAKVKEAPPERSHDPFNIDAILDELQGKRGEFPIKLQHDGWIN